MSEEQSKTTNPTLSGFSFAAIGEAIKSPSFDGVMSVFGLPVTSGANQSTTASSVVNNIGVAVGEAITEKISTLKDFISKIEIPDSLDQLIGLPDFSALKEKFSFLDTIDIFEISQDRFNELVEGAFE